MATPEIKQPPTGTAGSDTERRAANRLADALRERGRAVSIEPVSVRVSEAGTISVHGLLALAGGLLGLKWPLIGAAIVLIAAFSFYAERSLGLPLIGRLIPRRASQNVLSPPPGPAWDDEIEVVLTAGYDLPSAYPAGEWLSRRLSGQITTDRVLLWTGMLPVFLALMMRAAEVEGTWVGVIQLFGSAMLLATVAAQIDRGLAKDAEAADADLKATDNLLAVLDEALDETEGDAPIAICFFGAESCSAKGAAAFFSGYEGSLRSQDAVVVNFVNGAPADAIVRPGHKPKALITAREGDLATLRMNDELGAKSPIKPEPAILRKTTAATEARRRGLRATSVVGSGDDAIDVGLDVIENTHPEENRA
ncbi:MAG: hypothetical protein M3Y23_03225 [Actinomycetota bacterium]|nr:hypothetical protein [Actinomycetota bacterium]